MQGFDQNMGLYLDWTHLDVQDRTALGRAIGDGHGHVRMLYPEDRTATWTRTIALTIAGKLMTHSKEFLRGLTNVSWTWAQKRWTPSLLSKATW